MAKNSEASMKESVVKNILSNIKAFFTVNFRRYSSESHDKVLELEEKVAGLTLQLHYLSLLEYFDNHKAQAAPYEKELEYLRQKGNYTNFPYAPNGGEVVAESGFDKAVRLPYVVHKGKKLYFPADCTPEKALELYLYYLQEERLLGDAESDEAPHQYQSPNFRVAEGDVLFDIGAGEGLFALDLIDKVSRVVVVENDPKWMEPLKCTFAPFGDKVTFLWKCVSVSDSDTTVSLGRLLSDIDYKSAFVKMDIEGCELPSIIASEAVLKQKKRTKLAIASYHKQHDADELKALFDRMGYDSEFSNGYMLFHLYDTPTPPYFRHGVIRAKSID